VTHRRDVIWLDIADSADDVRRKIADTGYSRFPVCEGELDHLLGTCVRARS
jgi:putative hemolysin